MKSYFSLLAALLLVACAPLTPTPEHLQSAYYGAEPSRESVISLVKAHMSQSLFDPYSAVYEECSVPRKAWVNWYGALHYGYVVRCNINAKNRFGAYVGARQFVFMINDGRVTLKGDDFAHVGYVP